MNTGKILTTEAAAILNIPTVCTCCNAAGQAADRHSNQDVVYMDL